MYVYVQHVHAASILYREEPKAMFYLVCVYNNVLMCCLCSVHVRLSAQGAQRIINDTVTLYNENMALGGLELSTKNSDTDSTEAVQYIMV